MIIKCFADQAKHEMSLHDINLHDALVTDSHKHLFVTYTNNKPQIGWYQATHDPFNLGDGSLMCSYGLDEDPKQYYYYSHQDVWSPLES